MTGNERTYKTRLKLTIRGAVQGVGFRPFVYRLATELGLAGWVSNTAQGLFIEVEGERDVLDVFRRRVEREIPPRAFIQSLESAQLDPADYEGFTIVESDSSGEKSALVLPDIGTCPDCLKEIFDPANRRYLYPFTNCTNCGPRFSIIEALPYDRPNTSMKAFPMCPECGREYHDPLNRRFHAQPNACPRCGPQVALWDRAGAVIARDHEAVTMCMDVIRCGGIAALKGIGGFHLMVAAASERGIRRLRRTKHREEKPLALMFPSLDAVKVVCDVSELEEHLLVAPEAPIVILRRREPGTPGSNGMIAPSVAPGNPYLGAMLPYSPLHHILMQMLKLPVVATSGNISDEPMCTDEREAVQRLGRIADVFLVHNRPIVRHVDDSVLRVLAGRSQVIRRARGYAPLPVDIGIADMPPVLAVGAHLKNTIALSSGSNVFISQHIGDLETEEAGRAFASVIQDFRRLYERSPAIVVADLHPDYLSTKYAASLGVPMHRVQHHHAHVLSCMAENELAGRVLGVSWDGTGYGPDGTIWGGEFLLASEMSFERVASLRTFPLPGGEHAVKEPRRTALGLLYELHGDALVTQNAIGIPHAFEKRELRLLVQMLNRGINSPRTSSAGRLFDAVAALIGLRERVRFEGQAAMELEFAIGRARVDASYRFGIRESGGGSFMAPGMVVDWEESINGILADVAEGIPRAAVAAKFHNTLTEMIVAVARRVGEERVVLTGGCFQNRYLTERTVQQLAAAGFRPYWHQRVPPNDGGIALGQVFAVRHFRCVDKSEISAPKDILSQQPIEEEQVS
jgi:hydrogenase maturation protein HypF